MGFRSVAEKAVLAKERLNSGQDSVFEAKQNTFASQPTRSTFVAIKAIIITAATEAFSFATTAKAASFAVVKAKLVVMKGRIVATAGAYPQTTITAVATVVRNFKTAVFISFRSG